MRDSEQQYVRVAPESLLRFCAEVFARLGLCGEDARAAADVLVAADMRGILPPAGFRRDMDTLLARLRACPPAVGCERVYFAGEREREAETECRREGVPVLRATYNGLCRVGGEEGVEPPPVGD